MHGDDFCYQDADIDFLPFNIIFCHEQCILESITIVSVTIGVDKGVRDE